MTYTKETRSKTARTKQILETTELKILRRTTGKTLMEMERQENIKKNMRVENINDWVLNRKRQ